MPNNTPLALLEGENNATANYNLIQTTISGETGEFVILNIPVGHFYVAGSIEATTKRLLIRGAGRTVSKLDFIPSQDYCLKLSKNGSSYNFGSEIKDITLKYDPANADPNNPNTDILVLSLEKQRGLRMNNVSVSGGVIGVKINFVYDVAFNNVYISDFSTVGMKITDVIGASTTVYLVESHIEGAGDAMHISGVHGLRVIRTIVQANVAGIVEKDRDRESIVYIQDAHFEGNAEECYRQERPFKAGKSPSYLSIENTSLLSGPATPSTQNVIQLDFGSIYLRNSISSYQKGISRLSDSIGQEYAFDSVKNYFFENPVRDYFDYDQIVSKNDEFSKYALPINTYANGSYLEIDNSPTNTKNINFYNFIMNTNTANAEKIKTRRIARPGVFKIQLRLPYQQVTGQDVGADIELNGNLIQTANIVSEDLGNMLIVIEEELKLSPDDEIKVKLTSSSGNISTLDNGYLTIERLTVL